MRVLHRRHTIILAAAVSATALAAAGPAASDTEVNQLSQHGEWTAGIAHPAEQHRSRYQLKLDEARTVLAAMPATERGTDV